MDFWLWIGSFVLIFCNSCVNHARRHLLPFHRWWKLRGVKWPSQDQTADKQHVPGFSDPKPNSFGWSMMLLRGAPSSHSCPEVFGFTGERLSHYWLACLWCLLEVTHYRLRLFYEDCTFSLVSYVTSRKIILCCCSNQSLQQESVRDKRSRASQGNPETAVAIPEGWMLSTHFLGMWTWLQGRDDPGPFRGALPKTNLQQLLTLWNVYFAINKR